MEKEKPKGLSLRKKRGKVKNKPVIGPPCQVPMPPMPGARLPNSHISGVPPSIRSRDKEKVADLVKRRMSTRFPVAGENDDDSSVPALPAVPTMLPMHSGSSVMISLARPTWTGVGIELDLEAFHASLFSPETFVSTVLANATEDEILEFQKRLEDIRNRASSDLQKNVFVNRTQFIVISKEIDKLKSEMRMLRGLLMDLNITTGSLKTEALLSSTTSDIQARKTTNRTSVADLTALHMSHLQALWKQVEGAQKFLPSVPGRHIVLESREWIELNAASWKPRRIVHMVLLNDHILIATVKKKRTDINATASTRTTAPQIKNVAEKCWPLSEIEIVDLPPESTSSRRGVANAINLRVGKDSFVYQNSDIGKKRDLLRQFKKSADELRKAMRAETEDSLRRRDSIAFLSGRDPYAFECGELLESLNIGGPVFTVEGQPRTLRWIESQMDELDEQIAHRKFESAVAAIGKLRSLVQPLAKSNPFASTLVDLKIDDRASRLASVIVSNLTARSAHKPAIKASTLWLVKLGFEDLAREAFLDARSTVIKHRTRQVRFDGDVAMYISQVALAQFTLIKNTVEIYNTCFEPRIASALISWISGHVSAYVEILHVQLQALAPESKVYSDCLEITQIHSTMLVDCGLDFKELRNRKARTEKYSKDL